ncbi:4-(cytidine 5'-diphospho)-2-C-methyl-D-erythritol kinase [Desulfurella sp.]|uniref:4-(cytidine 5'-diphospho)-2-C-methyl-D-erythritol kinase n=1 Tax=Desulfurella sp. TaxID=1962857 RepID=UPI0025C43CC9|nr:4-(cytidine 5'-diphospho)-2-C-methyl-D-erythritol kinase [Desulfurella sp.]
MIVKSYAKINLALYVLDKRNDGYHNIVSLVTKIDLFDTIEIKPSKTLSVLTSIDSINNEQNLAYRAAKAFFEQCHIKDAVQIDIEKNIPLQAGLGGGSSNAAYVLLALNKMYEYPLSFDELVSLASSLGSDCVLFLYQNACIVCSRGEKAYKLNYTFLPEDIIIIKPPFGVSTKLAYSNLILTKHNNINRMKLVDKLNKGGPLAVMHNDLESSVFKLYPVLERIKLKVYEIVQNALLCGSGSSIFAFAQSSADQIISVFDESYFIKKATILNNEGRFLYEHYRS